MIFFRDKKGRVYLQKWDAKAKRGKVLPRAESRHLDQMLDEEIQAQLDSINPRKVKPDMCEVRKLGESWLAHLGARKLDRQTVAQRRSGLERFVFKFFLEVEQIPLKDWPDHTAKFHKWMIQAGRTPGQVLVANTALRKFYKWLAEENVVKPVQLALRSAVTEKSATPLARPLGPEEVLEWALKCNVPHIKFLGLAGYFFSLRPQEAFALTRQDFRNSSEISKLECVRIMKEAGLDTSLVVYIGKQKQKLKAVVSYAKSGSNGWVCCFNPEAAALLLEMLLGMQPQEMACKLGNEMMYTHWKKYGIPGVSIKDLRRASAYYLGHYSKLTALQLMKHMRHKKIETTMIYCRRPDQDIESAELVNTLSEIKKRHLVIAT